MARLGSRVMSKKATGDRGLGERLRQARELAGLTQAQLGEKVGVEQPSISAFETGSAMPELGTLKKLAQSLEESVEFLTLGSRTDVARELQDFTDAILASLARRAWRSAARLSDDQRLQAAEEIAALLEAKGKGQSARPKKIKRSR
jgi:transcriptional regulator with XRE-family HTH domain